MNIKKYLTEHLLAIALHLIAIAGVIMVIWIPQENIMFCIGLALMIYGLLMIGSLPDKYDEQLEKEKAMCIICNADEELAGKVVRVIEEHEREKKEE